MAGTFSRRLPNAIGSFTIDLSLLINSCTDCGIILATGTHVVQVYGTIGGTCAEESHCRQTSYLVVPAFANPWADDLQVLVNPVGRDSAVIKFSPGDSCGLPDCKAIRLIQSIRLRKIVGPDTICVPISATVYRQYSGEQLDKMALTLTPACVRIDAGPNERDPYMNGGDHDDTGAAGQSGVNLATSIMSDVPEMVPGSDTLLSEFEVNAYCEKGVGQGRYLGKMFWIYKVAPGEQGRAMADPRRGPDLGPPTPEFLAADSLWRKEMEHSKARAARPSKGGEPCP